MFGKESLLYVLSISCNYLPNDERNSTPNSLHTQHFYLERHPPILQKSLVVKHRQTWKLREHHLLATEPVTDSPVPTSVDDFDTLSPGDPLRSYFPTGTHIKEDRDGLEVRDLVERSLYITSEHVSFGQTNRDTSVISS